MKKRIYTILAFSLLPTAAIFAAEAEAAGTASNADLNLLYVLVGLAAIQLLVAYFLSNTLKSLTSNNEWVQAAFKKRIDVKNGAATAILLLISTTLFAQDNAASAPFVMSDMMFWSLVSLNVFLFFIVLFLFGTIKNAINILTGKAFEETKETVSVFDKALIALTDTVPIERENDVLTDHEYDGIRELDNNLPPWWVWGFYLTIVFALVYMFYYHFSSGPLMAEEYAMEMAEGNAVKEAYMAKMANSVDEKSVVLITDASKLAEGKNIYMQNCAACHGAEGQGGVGPNLTDEFWLHGGSINDVFKIIKYGVPEKGMISWQAQFSPPQMQSIASYILGMQGSNPANAKEAQGERYTPQQTAPEVSESKEDIQQAGI